MRQLHQVASCCIHKMKISPTFIQNSLLLSCRSWIKVWTITGDAKLGFFSVQIYCMRFINRCSKMRKRKTVRERGARADPLFQPNIGLKTAVDMHQRYSALYWVQTDTHNRSPTHSTGMEQLQLSCKRGTNNTLEKYL